MRIRSSFVLSLVASLSLTLAAGAAEATPDLAVTVSQPAVAYVYQPVRYTVTVANVGSPRSAASTLRIELPETNTSPTVHLLGTLGAMTAGCTRAGTTVTCPVPRINAGRSAVFTFDLEIPETSAPVSFDAAVTPGGPDSASANNRRTHVANLRNYSYVIAPTSPLTVANRHCTGQGLTSFFECELYPSSLSDHDVLFHPGGAITIPIAGPDYAGTWSQPTPDSLVFQYTENGTPVANFVGYGVGGRCFEGVTTFPDSVYVSPYEVCLP